MRHITILLFLLFVKSSITYRVYKVGQLRTGVITRLERVYENVWGLNIFNQSIRSPSTYNAEFIEVCRTINSLRTFEIPSQFIPSDLIRLEQAINSRYSEFNFLVGEKNDMENKYEWKSLTYEVVGKRDEDLKTHFYSLLDLTYNTEGTSIFSKDLRGKYLNEEYTTKQTRKQSIYYLYLLTQKLQMKAYTMLQYWFNIKTPDRETADLIRKEWYYSLRRQDMAVQITMSSLPNSTNVFHQSLPSKPYNNSPEISPPTYNKISLRSIHSNIKNNRVIVGFRAVNVNKVLYIQPQDGILLPNGEILQSSVDWVPLPMKNTLKEDLYHLERNSKTFHYMILDNLYFPKDLVATGIRFGLTETASKLYLSIELRGTVYSMMTGKVHRHPKMSTWFYTPHKQRRDTIQILPSHLSETLMYNGKYELKFSNSSNRASLDMRPAITKPALPIVGVGTHLMKAKYQAYVLSFRIYSPDFFMKLNFPTPPMKNISWINCHI